MITIKIRQWVPIGGVTHTSTSYQVSSDIAFTNILDNHLSDVSNLTVYYSPVDVPVNTTYYVRVMRNFSNATDSGWGDPIAVTNTDANNGILSYQPVKVYQPIVLVDKVAIDDPLVTSYTVTTSAFSGVNEGHGYTIWCVLNDKDETIEYIKSTTNLTSITFTKGVSKLTNTKYIRIIAIHGTLTNIESSPGEVIINITGVDFSLSTVSDIVTIGTDLVVNITRPANLTNTVVSVIDITDINGTVLWTIGVSPSMTSITVPGAIFIADSHYEIIGYGVPADSTHRYVLPIKTMPDYGVGVIQPGYVYNKTIARSVAVGLYPKVSSLRGITLPSGLTVSSDATSTAMRVIRNQDGTYTKTTQFGLQSLTSVGIATEYLRLLSGDRELIIGNVTTTTHSINLRSIDYYNNTTNLLSSLTLPGVSPSNNGGIVTSSNDIFYMANAKEPIWHKISIIAGILSNVDIILPTGETGVETIASDVGGNILVFCVGSNVIYSYNPSTGTYTRKHTLPLEFRNRHLKQEELINGDAVVWKPVRSEVVGGVTITDTILDMLYIDNKNSRITNIKPINGITYNVDGSVLTSDGKLLLLTNETVGTNVLVFE